VNGGEGSEMEIGEDGEARPTEEKDPDRNRERK
jgi:hypothetical protein